MKKELDELAEDRAELAQLESLSSVRAYTRKNGKLVKGHKRRPPAYSTEELETGNIFQQLEEKKRQKKKELPQAEDKVFWRGEGELVRPAFKVLAEHALALGLSVSLTSPREMRICVPAGSF